MNAWRPLRIALIGWGAIGRRIGELLAANGPAEIRIVAVGVRDAGSDRPDLPPDARVIGRPDELEPGMADLVIEAAGRSAVAEWAEAALSSAPGFVVASTSALADTELTARLVELAARNDSRILIPSGALAGIDALAAAGALDLSRVEHSIIKPARAWAGTEAEDLCDLAALSEPVAFASGSARQIADRFPKNANVAVISALAGLGLDRTQVRLVADPGATRNAHHIIAEGAFGRMETKVENEALALNPKSSELTVLSLYTLIRRQSARLVI